MDELIKKLTVTNGEIRSLCDESPIFGFDKKLIKYTVDKVIRLMLEDCHDHEVLEKNPYGDLSYLSRGDCPTCIKELEQYLTLNWWEV